VVQLPAQAIETPVREHDHRPRPHRGVTAGTALALEEPGGVVGCLVLDHRSHGVVVVADLERGGGYYDIGAGRHAGFLRTVRPDRELLFAAAAPAEACGKPLPLARRVPLGRTPLAIGPAPQLGL